MTRQTIIYLFIVLLSTACRMVAPSPQIHSGELDLQNFPFESRSALALKGDWKFFPNEFHIDSDAVAPTLLPVPALWNQVPLRSGFGDGKGYGTYVLDIKLPEENQIYSVYLPEVRTAFRLEAGNRSLVSGMPGKTKETTIPSAQGQSFTISAKDHIQIRIEVSNFHHKEGGLLNTPVFGLAESVQNYILAQSTIDLALTGAIFMFGLYHFILFFYRNKQREAFYFGFFCLVFAARIPFIGSKTIYAVFPNIPWELVIYVEYASVFVLGILFLWFVDGLFPRFIDTKLILYFSAFVQFMLVYGLIIKPEVYTQFEVVFQVLGVVYAVFLGIRLYQMVARGLPDAGIFFLGYLVLFFGFVYDVFLAYSDEGESTLSQIAVFLFFGVQSTIVTLRTTRTFHKKVLLKEEFESINEQFILTNRFYAKFIPRDFLTHLGKESIEEVRLGDSSEREMTVLFADIWEYWDIIYSIPLENRMLFTNSYLGRIGPCVRKNNGFIDKYIGSAIMALFDGGIQNSIKAAEDIQWELEKYNERRRTFGYLPLHAGIGIHSGDTMLGILGEEERLESTVISDTVNLSSRIQGLTKKYGARILVSLTSLMLHEDLDTIPYRILDFVRVKGKQETVMIAEVLIPDIDIISNKKIENKDRFEAAIFDYERADFVSALEGFREVFANNPEDLAAQIYIERCEYYQIAGVGEDWDGVSAWEK
ncbi:adenylate/guanylate cyclase domain-containing protein [Leptospira sp. 2 VSF19]|uniref:Adenylate/guanylate cyclase domain-containing protein n=1 Tax=Leptospira soteropolitanensis TaxID=2950025 RepID=A0AAW5VHD4_9LEPT|nr:adenylate/guanylate cyclase domain-containing protein [Leptospira soteropolitanensis]MCW7491055.1 adenylate/guanylate cyclase domain-containing protein [Leptospira soteropolitanensis]MCW7498639.1 adenylate/guanylate cyclase domain-containing protein [Leptospira soteropolitanensis]MCW7521768.1 adenylate/guanylate cyclase domain-containing protein [Leptospira soteropolitanensis]MCW7524743.1 adenylate/guanylate cyclase domain-containing protein [Leptospira soteropolitanensis]MCW7528610.1 adeny